MEISTLKNGRRGRTNHARKVAMYPGKRQCDLALEETSEHFEVESYGVVG